VRKEADAGKPRVQQLEDAHAERHQSNKGLDEWGEIFALGMPLA
jgi:hypothetical protein